MSEQASLLLVPEAKMLPADSLASLMATFTPLYDQADKLIAEAGTINVTDATQVTEIKKSREKRLEIGRVRIASEKARKQAKENSLRVGQAIDAIAKKITAWCEPVEARLLAQEQFAERVEAARKAEAKVSRTTALIPYVGTDSMFYDLAEMPEATFQKLLQSSKTAYETKLAEAAAFEKNRLAAIAAREEEQRLIRVENERLKKEAEEKEASRKAELAKLEAERMAAEAAAKIERDAIEAKAKKEREAAEAAAKQEREARAKAEMELAAEKQRQADAEAERIRLRQQQIKAAVLAAAKAKREPDKAKIAALVAQIRSLLMPDVTSDEAKALIVRTVTALESIAVRLFNESQSL